MRKLLAVLLLILWCGGAAVEAGACVPAQGEPLRVGVVFPPDSLFSTDAADSYRGVQAMATAVNACGGVNSQPVELVYASAGNYDDAVAAVDSLKGDVPLVIGSGSAIVSEVLANAAGQDTFFYWEVTEPLDEPHAYALSPRPNNGQLGAQAAMFAANEVAGLLDGEPLRVALVYEDNPRAKAVVDGVRAALQEPPLIERSIEESGYPLAVQMREQHVNVVIMAAFARDVDRLWFHLREADANLAAWAQVGGDDYRRNMCSRIGNIDGIISISAAGAVNDEYRLLTFPAIYELYTGAYQEQFQRAPGERADLAASAMWMLLRQILPAVDGDFTPAAISTAATNITGASLGLMSEGWTLDTGTWVNQAAAALVAQQQNGAFCTIAPDAAATCTQPLQLFPTWRERARTTSCETR